MCYIIAEGIETKGDSEKINHIGIHLHQGWYHGRPMSAEKSRRIRCSVNVFIPLRKRRWLVK
ncbi:uncharacterized protein MP3633_0275 [Marinomonas primoryensis]|uniref:EAL domain-containing protein n=1 Tax=Marinomonas primoryensis TaxID=178399 RepID=A0A859CS55_9GAMM|nr:uncharacterized protein MP3633_0275 [Marinomonas primoryensis]